MAHFKKKILRWSQQFKEVLWLDSNGHTGTYTSFDGALALDAQTSLTLTDPNMAFQQLKTYQARTRDWIFGYLSYDLKNDLEDLDSSNTDGLHFPELFFFQPKRLIFFHGDQVHFLYTEAIAREIESDFEAILNGDGASKEPSTLQPPPRIKMRISKDNYFKKVSQILHHIHRGDIYEANFCQEFYVENSVINVLGVYHKLNGISRPPFAVFLKMGDKYLLSASPERFLRKQGNKVISQPIKGTAKRAEDPEADQCLKEALERDEKERAENIMIVDLVRNDLSKSALKGTVTVEELCKVYSYEQVHQLVSTITARVASSQNPIDILRETFPMGSMTGAPKVSAMRIIETLEETKRGLYSGSVGYIDPQNNFDFNVVIRSILYNETERYASFSVGSAITAKSAPEREYEECLLKARAMRQVLEDCTTGMLDP